MPKIQSTHISIAALLLAVLSCAAAAVTAARSSPAAPGLAPTPAQQGTSEPDNANVLAEGRLAPIQFANLSFGAAGPVEEVLVRKGQTVQAGDVIARLENSALVKAELALAETEARNAQQRIDQLAGQQNGPDPDNLASEQERLAAAQVALAAAQEAVKHAELRAPFAGVVADLKVKVGERAAPGQVAVVLADFSQWILETDDLTEIQVVNVAVGNSATLRLDALPDMVLHGQVTAISPLYNDNRGDVNYTVTVQLSDGDPRMRWGMKGQTTFGK
jgi:HlyD family secretion protein